MYGDLLYSREGSYHGIAAEIPEDVEICMGQRMVLIRPDREFLNFRFLKYWLNSKFVRDFISGMREGSGAPRINLPTVRGMAVPVPEIREQEAISSILGALDDKIAVNERIAATYEQLLQCRFAELGLGDEPDGESEIPITDLIAFGLKLSKPAAAEPVYVDMAALQTNRAGIPCWTRREPKSGPRFMNGDTLMARITPCLENGKTGYVDFMEDGEIGLGSTEFIVLRSLPGVPSELSYFLARDSRFREHAIRNMVGSSGRQRVSAADASNYSVRSPDTEQLAAFGREASAAFAHMKSLESESRALAALRDTLLPQLMSGRLRVKDAEKIVEDHV
ncbi:restriction endonuclease subunit S [Streptomyces sp. NPDC056362]|uniref:restriction endonuclease subunit S n=1 Tax=unclassified Streptomyces TaxID=2593676 RepID=UPI0035D69790